MARTKRGPRLLAEWLKNAERSEKTRLGHLLDVHRITLWRWASGRTAPGLSEAIRLSVETGIPVDSWS